MNGEHSNAPAPLATERRFLCKGVKWIVEDETEDDIGYPCPGCADCRETAQENRQRVNDEGAREIERLRLRADGHSDTLRGIASMNPATEGERMRQWALDGLSGYTDSTESTVKKLMDEIERLTRELGTERSGHLLTVGERNWCSKEVDQLREALDMLYDRWENGDPCDEGGGDGRVIEISYEEEKTILSLLKDFKTPQGESALIPPSTREPVVTAPQGNAGESPASVSCRGCHERWHRQGQWHWDSIGHISECTATPKLAWRGVVPHDPAECGPCEVELREIERNAKPPLGSVSRHDATKFGGRHVELPDDDPGEPK